jgi:TPP-dependent pyruvate/acetoin dehydrogenase alpha subunit
VMKGEIHVRAAGFGLATTVVDGMNVRAVRDAAMRAVERARGGGGPSFLECDTRRYSVHNVSAGSAVTDERPEQEQAAARARDPIERLAGELIVEDRWTLKARAIVDREIETEIDGGLGFARNSLRPQAASAYDFMYSRTYPGLPAPGVDSPNFDLSGVES